MNSKPLHMSDAMDRAWHAYRQGVEDVRHLLFNHRFAEGERERNEAMYLFQQIQAEAFNITTAPRPDFPRFATRFEPPRFSWGVPNADFTYSSAYLDGRRTYRIWGKRNNAMLVLMQSLNAHLTLPPEQVKFLGNYDFDKMELAPDGRFEMIASATPHDGNWIRLDPEIDRNALILREVFVDWENAVRSEIHIEAIDDVAPKPMVHGEADIIRRLEDAVRFMKTAASTVSINLVDEVVKTAGWNSFVAPRLGVAAAAAPEATYNMLAYDIGPDDALIIEIDPPAPKYWGIQLSDLWNQTIDYTYHHSSLNMRQAAVDADGRIRVVICHRDPGIANWLTPVDSRKGTVMVRWYLAQGIATPSAKLVAYDAIEASLPEGAARITPEARAANMRKRRVDLERRYPI